MSKPPVCVDLDGVLASWGEPRGKDGIGMPLPGAVEFTKALGEKYTVIIHSCRLTEVVMGETWERQLEKVTGWLCRHGFYFDEVHVGQGKPHAIAYVDDRAVPCLPEKYGESDYATALRRVDRLAE